VPAGVLVAGGQYAWNMRASNSAGWGGYSTLLYFTVAAAPPLITGVSPNPVPGSNSQQTISISGSSFVFGASVTLTSLGVTYPIPASRTTFVSSSEIQIFVDVGTEAASWTVQVINPNEQASNVFTFTVT
jgi:hypothetical protein